MINRERAIRICLWILGFAGIISAGLFLSGVLAQSELLSIIGIVLSLVPMLLDLSQRRFQATILKLVLQLSAEYVAVLKYLQGKSETLDEIAAKGKMTSAEAFSIMNELISRGLVEEYSKKGQSYYRLSNLGKTTINP